MNVVGTYSKKPGQRKQHNQTVMPSFELEVVTNWTNGMIVKMHHEYGVEKGYMEYIPDEFMLKLHVRTKESADASLYEFSFSSVYLFSNCYLYFFFKKKVVYFTCGKR